MSTTINNFNNETETKMRRMSLYKMYPNNILLVMKILRNFGNYNKISFIKLKYRHQLRKIINAFITEENINNYKTQFIQQFNV